MLEGKEVDIYTRLFELDRSSRKAFDSMAEELDDHLLAINENTEEIGATNNWLSEIEEKMDKLNGRIDSMHMMFRQLLTQASVKVDLTLEEQKLFMLLNNYNNFLRFEDVCSRLCWENDELMESIISLCDKGIPVIRKEAEKKSFLKLDDDFRKLQQKEGIIKISPAITQQFENRVLKSFFC